MRFLLTRFFAAFIGDACRPNFAREGGYSSIRLDTYTANTPALALYERRGYQRTGQIRFANRTLPFPFDCFEKML